MSLKQSRAHFSKETKRLAFERSHGICECHRIPHVFKTPCGCALGPGNTFYEHIDIDPDAISHRNDLDNCAVLTKTCCRIKTNIYDKRTVAKSNRVRDRARGIYKSRTITQWRRFDGTPRVVGRER